jgi:spermidine synthase
MSTLRTGSEIALAKVGCENLAGLASPRVLVGGLGLGFTLRSALECLPPDGRLVVAELFPKVVEWNRTHLKERYGDALHDPRLEIVVSDVWDQIGKGGWSAILLDTDNGPDEFCLPHNNRLYGNHGLERLYEAMVPGGRLAIWCAQAVELPKFVRRMEIVGFTGGFRIEREHGETGHPYAIFIGDK